MRDIIYDYTWLANPVPDLSHEDSRQHIYALYFCVPLPNLYHWSISTEEAHCTRGLPRWLLTSNKILDEGLKFFDRRGTMYIGSSGLCLSHNGCDPKYVAEDDQRESWYNRDAFCPLLPPFQSPRLCIHFQDHFSEVREDCSVFVWDYRDFAYCQDLFTDARRAGKLKHLDIWLTVNPPRSATEYEVDLEPLAELISSV